MIRHQPVNARARTTRLFQATTKKASVCVFHMSSLNESMILSLQRRPDEDVSELARRCCGRSIFVGWPHLLEVPVASMSNGVPLKFQSGLLPLSSRSPTLLRADISKKTS